MFVGIDLETTGVSLEDDSILEVAAIVVSDKLEVLASKSWVLSCDPEILEGMDEWCQTTHSESGLLSEVHDSDYTLEEVGQELHDFISDWTEDEDNPLLLGNSVHFDRAFLRRDMRKAHDLLSHRNIDVSTIRELLKKWAPEALYEVNVPHRALSDILASLESLVYYKRNLF